MTDVALTKPPAWFWVIAVLALLWNAIGCVAYFAEVAKTPEDLAAMTEEVRTLYENVPTWAVAGFAIGVWGGLLGSLLLLLRSRWALPVYVLSLLGVLAQWTHTLFLTNTMEVMEQGPVMPALVVLICCFLVWFASHARGKRWLR